MKRALSPKRKFSPLKLIAYDKECEVYFDPDKIVFLEVTLAEYDELMEDEDRTWRPFKEVQETPVSLHRNTFEICSELGQVVHY